MSVRKSLVTYSEHLLPMNLLLGLTSLKLGPCHKKEDEVKDTLTPRMTDEILEKLVRLEKISLGDSLRDVVTFPCLFSLVVKGSLREININTKERMGWDLCEGMFRYFSENHVDPFIRGLSIRINEIYLEKIRFDISVTSYRNRHHIGDDERLLGVDSESS